MRAIYNKSSLLVARINNGEMCGNPPPFYATVTILLRAWNNFKVWLVPWPPCSSKTALRQAFL